jgi:integrase
VKAEHVDSKHCRWVFPQSKAKGKRAPRIVYLPEPAMEIVKSLMVQYPDGPLFRNSDGEPWTTDAVNCVFTRIQFRMGKALSPTSKIILTENEIKEKVKTLRPTIVKKGIESEKTKAELRSEARVKLRNQKARALVPRYSLYALRHSWATNALKSNVDSLTVAILMGHSDPSMLARVYQHLSHSPEHMLQQAELATRWLPGKS